MPTKPVTLDHLKKKKQRTRRSFRIGTDESVEEEWRESKNQLELAKQRARRFPTDASIAEEYAASKAAFEAAEKAMAANSIKITFESIGYKSYDQLLTAHLMSEERRKQLVEDPRFAQGGMDSATWDPETYPTALIVASVVEPDVGSFKDRMHCGILRADVDDEAWKNLTGPAKEFCEWVDSDEWNAVELQMLFQTALEANVSSRVVELGNF